MKTMRALAFLMLLLSLSAHAADEPVLGLETVQPVFYPKFSLNGHYNMGRHVYNLGEQRALIALPNRFAGSLSFEAGLYRYFNAGASLAVQIPQLDGENVPLRLSLFGKPQIPIGDRCAFFSLVSAGLSTSFGTLIASTTELRNLIGEASFFDMGFGAHTALVIGFEYFPWSRIGFAVNGGVDLEFFRYNRTRKSKSPNSLHYLIYQFPIGLSMHVII